MTEAGSFKRVLGPIDATCIVAGAIIGVGIFFTPSRVVLLAGSGQLALIAWAVGGFIAMCGALTFAELGGRFPRTAGQYEILRDAFGSLPAFAFVFCYSTVITPGAIAIIAIICAQNLSIAVTGQMPGNVATACWAGLLTIGLTIINLFGVRWGAGIQNVTVVAKLIALLAIIGLAMFLGQAEITGVLPVEGASPIEADQEGQGLAERLGPTGVMAAMFAALVPLFFSFGGWQQVLWVGGEVRDPGRNIPRAITIGVIIVIVVYLVVNWAYLRLLGPAGVANSKALAADAVAAVWPDAGRRIVAAAVAVSAFGVLNVNLLTGPRLVQGLSADGRFYAMFESVHSRWRTPVPATFLLVAASLILLGVSAFFGDSPINQLLNGVVFVDCVFFALTGLALMMLRSRPDLPLPVKVPLYPLVPIIFVLGELAIMVGALMDEANRNASIIGLIWLALAAAAWFHCEAMRGPATKASSEG